MSLSDDVINLALIHSFSTKHELVPFPFAIWWVPVLHLPHTCHKTGTGADEILLNVVTANAGTCLFAGGFLINWLKQTHFFSLCQILCKHNITSACLNNYNGACLFLPSPYTHSPLGSMCFCRYHSACTPCTMNQ